MRTEFTLPDSEPINCQIEFSTEHSASSDGQPALVTEDGDVIDQISWNFHRIISATPDEIEQLKALGLHTHHL